MITLSLKNYLGIKMTRTILTITTNQKQEIINITSKLEAWLRQIKVKEGVMFVNSPHSTTGLIINEDETGLKRDILSLTKTLDLLGMQVGGFAHNRIDQNASAHLGSMIFGNQLFLPINNGRLQRGQWQEILLIEFDGPRERQLNIIFLT